MRSMQQQQQQRSPRKPHALQRPLQPLLHSGVVAPVAASASAVAASSSYPSRHPLSEMSAAMDARIAATEAELEGMLQSEHAASASARTRGEGQRPALRLDIPSHPTPALSASSSSSRLDVPTHPTPSLSPSDSSSSLEIPLHVTVEPADPPRASAAGGGNLHGQRQQKPVRPQHPHSAASAPPISPSPPSLPPSLLAPPPAGRGRHARRESRFLAQAALLDLESEAAILAPRMTAAAAAAAAGSASHSAAGPGGVVAAPTAVSLALTAALLHGTELPSTATAVAALSDPASLAALVTQPASVPAPTGYSLLDGALARKRQRMADILNGLSGLDGEQKHMQPLPPSTHQLREDIETARASSTTLLSPFAPATGASAFSFAVPPVSPRSVAAAAKDGVTLQLPSPRRGGHGHAHHRTLTGFDSNHSSSSWPSLPLLPDADGGPSDEKQDGGALSFSVSPRNAVLRVPISKDIHGVDEDVTGAAIYHSLIDSPEALAAEEAVVQALLRQHQHQMAHRVPLEVQLRLARLHYKQAEGEFRPNLLDHAMEEAEKNQQQKLQQQQKQKQLQRSGSQSARTAVGAGGSSSTLASNRPSPRSSRPHLLAPSDSLSSLHSIPTSSSARARGSGSALLGVNKITFLTQSASDSSLALADHLASTASRGTGLANHAAPQALASVNDPYRARHVAFSYADRFEPLELAMLREPRGVLGGAFAGHESLAFVVPRTDLGRSAAAKPGGATMYRKSRAHDVSLMAKSLANLAELNRGTPGPASYLAPPSSFDLAVQARSREGADSMGLGPTRLTSSGADSRLELLLSQASVGPGSYDQDHLSMARSAGMHAPRGSGGINEFAGLSAAPPLSNEQIQARNARNKLAIELNRFDARMKEMRALTTKASPGPGAHILRPPPAPPGSNAAVAYHARQVPPVAEEPSPGVGSYEAAPGMGGVTSLEGRHQKGAAGVATHFVGFGSSSSRTGLVAPSAASTHRDTTGTAGSAAPTRTERLIDFQRMPALTKRDKALIAADESWDRQSEALVAAAATGASPTTALPASRFGALLTADLLAASSASQSLYQRRALVTLRAPHILPATTMPWAVLASKDESLKLAWLRDRAASNNVRRAEALQRHRAMLDEKRARFLLLQSREAKIAARDALRVTQQRWLVLLVHGCVFGRYKSQHETDNRRARLLKAALVLQYYWRLKTARLVSSHRYQLLLAALRTSFLHIVVGFRIRRKRRALALVARFLGDHLATAASGMKSTRKMLNVIQRFRAAVRTIQRFARACLRRWKAEVEVGCKQLARTELKENATLATIAQHHPSSQFMPRSVREYAMQTLRAARDRMDEDRLQGVRSVYAPLETNKLLPKGATPKQQKQTAAAGADANSPRRTSSSGASSSPRRPSTFMSQLAAGGVLVRSAGAGSGKAKVASIFTPQHHLAAHEGKAAAATLHSLGPEASLRLSDAVRRSIVAAACKVRRRRHRQDQLRQAEAEQSYLSRHGSALQSGIELARVLLTGSSAKINQDRAFFARRYPPPFVHALFAEGEMRALLLNAFFLQAHLDEERLAVSRLVQAGQGRAAIRAARGLLTLALRQVLLRAPAAGVQHLASSALDHVRLGTALTSIHPGFQGGVPSSLLNKDEDVSDRTATLTVAHAPQHGHSHSPSAHLSLPAGAHGSSLSHGLAGSAQHQHPGGGGGVGGSMLSHGPQGSARGHREEAAAAPPPSAHRGGGAGHHPQAPSHSHSQSLAVPNNGVWHQSSPSRLDEYSYKSHNHLHVSLIAFHSTLAAAIQFARDHGAATAAPAAAAEAPGRGDAGAYPSVHAHADHLHAASLAHVAASAAVSAAAEEPEAPGASDPYFHNKSHATGMFPSVGLHVSRSAALKEAQRLSAQQIATLGSSPAASALVRSPFTKGKRSAVAKQKAAPAPMTQSQQPQGSIDEDAPDDGDAAAVDDPAVEEDPSAATRAPAATAAADADSPFKPRIRKPSPPSTAAAAVIPEHGASTGASAAALSASLPVAPASNFALALAHRKKEAQRDAERAAFLEAINAPAQTAVTAATANAAAITPASPISIGQPHSARFSKKQQRRHQRH